MILCQLLDRSSVTSDFREALSDFARSGRPNDRVVFDPYSPSVKVERTLSKMLQLYPELEIDAVEIEGSSGCEFYRGRLVIRTPQGERAVNFRWDCRWRAQKEGWVDYFGFPDQMRAAREFGYDCFQEWEELTFSYEL